MRDSCADDNTEKIKKSGNMPYCAILECKNDSRWKNITHGGISYHRFPKDPFIKGKWIEATGRRNWMPVKSSTICSDHFRQNDFLISEKGNRYLITTAIPTQKVLIVINETNPANEEVSASPSSKRIADFIDDHESLPESYGKKACKASLDGTSSDKVNYIEVKPGTSKHRDPINLGSSSFEVMIEKKPGMPATAQNENVIKSEETNPANKVSTSRSKKRIVDLIDDHESLSESCRKKVCKANVDVTSSDKVSFTKVMPGTSKKRDASDLDSSSFAVSIRKKPRMVLQPLQLPADNQNVETELEVSKKSAAEKCKDAITQKKPLKRTSNMLLEADLVTKKKLRKDVDLQSRPKKRVSDSTIDFYTSPKKSRKNEDELPGSTFSTPRKQKLSDRLRWAENKLKKQTIKIKRLQTQGRRLKKKLVNVEEILNTLKEKFTMASENLDSLKNINVQVQELVAREIGNVQANVISRKKYSPALRSFALTLHYYSPKAYEYVRSVFNTSLPHPRTLKNWYSTIGGDPGFTKESFAALKCKADSSTSPLVATLVIDEMSIRRRIEWDGKKLHGYVDMGTGIEGDHLAEAKEALVFLITAINSNFKVPVGFFLVDGVTGIQRAELVKQCLQMADSAGIKVVALTFDGCAANISMAGHLGCRFQDYDVKFDHPATHDPIVAVLDPCHMIKLIRNSFENYRTFVDAEGNKIEWKYLEQLNNLQYAETFQLANKLKDRHINFKNERMKVKLATQLFSLSVAEAIKFCRVNLNMESFRLSEPTEKFLVMFNNIFDIFNSKNLHQYGFKKALNQNNASNVFEFLNSAFQYISSLKLTDGTPVIKSLRKTGFLGFMNCIEALKLLYVSLIESKVLIYLPFYKLSQDHLELLFCNIRSHGGSNNNPTARQFISAYKKMLVHVELKDTGRGNCTALEQLSILNCSSAEERINRTSGLNISEDEDHVGENESSDYTDFDETQLSDFSNQAIIYIAGWIVKKMIKSIKCETCANALITTQDQSLHKLIIMKDKGGLQYPSKDVIRICQVAETFIKDFDGNNIKKDVVTSKILRQFVGTNVFDAISSHQIGEFPGSNHVTDLMKAVIVRYLNVRIHHLLKLKLKQSKRQLLNKYVLFQGQ